MNWIECKIKTSHEGIDIVTGILLNLGVEGVQIEDNEDFATYIEENKDTWDYADEKFMQTSYEDTTITFYISDDVVGNETVLNIKSAMDRLKATNDESLGKLDLCVKNRNEDEWVNNWKKYYKPFNIGNIVICPTWEEYEAKEEDVIFTIEPGNAFGTGLHHTTSLCIDVMQDYVKGDEKVLDLGCGSGILSVISLLLGAKEATAIDIEHVAKKSAYNNAELNNVEDRYTAICGNVIQDKELVESISDKKYDIVFANIVADVIIPITPVVSSLIDEDGIYITSGIIDNRLDEVKGVLNANGFEVIEHREKEGWNMLVSRVKR